ncbi:hypothetical protein IAU59_006810 [Kwoniella sp. CBS 9459]
MLALVAVLPVLAGLGVSAMPADLATRQVEQHFRVHPAGDDTLCLTAQGGSPKAGDAVELSKCFGDNNAYTGSEIWTLDGSGSKIKLTSFENLCLTLGTSSSGEINTPLLGPCSDEFIAEWTYSADTEKEGSFSTVLGRTSYCLDVDAGSKAVDGEPYGKEKNLNSGECADGNDNQKFTVESASAPNANSAVRRIGAVLHKSS